MTTLRIALALALVAACSSDPKTPGGGGGDDDPNVDAGGSGGNGVAPDNGTWHYDQLTPVANTCGQMLGQTDDGDFTISNSSSAGFHVTTSSESFDCVLSAIGFDCPDRAAVTTDASSEGFDAVFTGKPDANGVFDSVDHVTGHQTAHITCAGSQCAQAAAVVGATVPCDVNVAFSATHQ